MADVILTHDEAESLYNHLEFSILREIKDDKDIDDYDNMGYLANLMSIYAKCKTETEQRKKKGAAHENQGDFT